MWPAGVTALTGVVIADVWLLAQAASKEPSLLEYGAIGAVSLVALGAVKVLWSFGSKSLNDALERERANTERERVRGDRLEDELRKQNSVIQERFIVALNDSTRAVQETMAVLREHR